MKYRIIFESVFIEADSAEQAEELYLKETVSPAIKDVEEVQ